VHCNNACYFDLIFYCLIIFLQPQKRRGIIWHYQNILVSNNTSKFKVKVRYSTFEIQCSIFIAPARPAAWDRGTRYRWTEHLFNTGFRGLLKGKLYKSTTFLSQAFSLPGCGGRFLLGASGPSCVISGLWPVDRGSARDGQNIAHRKPKIVYRTSERSAIHDVRSLMCDLVL
jgi:hypothetical protein